MDHTYTINARFRRQRTTGVQRNATEIIQRLGHPVREIIPKGRASGIPGHAWEQFVLPTKMDGSVLWSPCNCGPLAVRRQVVTIHDLAVFDHPEWFSGNFARLYHTLLPRLARRVLRIATISDYSRNRIAEVFSIPLNKIERIYCGVSPFFKPQPAEDTVRAQQRYGLDDCRYFVTLGTLEPRKNLQLVLNAWPKVRDRLGPGVKLAIIGGGIQKSPVFREAAEMPGMKNVVFLGYVPDADLPSLLSGAIALAYPSLYEGFGLPPLEAMACGTPAIVTKFTSLPEVVQSAGLYTDPYDPTDLAQIMQELAETPALQEEYAGRGRERARIFSWEVAASQMDGLLSAL